MGAVFHCTVSASVAGFDQSDRENRVGSGRAVPLRDSDAADRHARYRGVRDLRGRDDGGYRDAVVTNSRRPARARSPDAAPTQTRRGGRSAGEGSSEAGNTSVGDHLSKETQIYVTAHGDIPDVQTTGR